MTSTQKGLAVAGLVAIAVTSFFAPYQYHAHNSLERIAGGHGLQFTSVTYAPLWSPPQDYRTELIPPQWLAEQSATGTVLDDLQLDSGKLGLWWAGIALVTVVAIILAAPRRA